MRGKCAVLVFAFPLLFYCLTVFAKGQLYGKGQVNTANRPLGIGYTEKRIKNIIKINYKKYILYKYYL